MKRAGAVLAVAAVTLVAVPGLSSGAPSSPTTTVTVPVPSTPPPPRSRPIVVVPLDGLIDPVEASLVERTLREAARDQATVVVLKIASRGALDTDVERLVRAIERSPVPVAVWVGGSGSRAAGGAVSLLMAAHVAAAAPGARLGPAVPADLRTSAGPARRDAEGRRLRALAARHGRSQDVAEDLGLHGRVVRAEEAQRRGGIDELAATLGEMIVSLDGRTVQVQGRPVTLSTARFVQSGGVLRREPNRDVRFRELGPFEQVQHAVTAPLVAMFLLLAGLALIVFEFFAIGIGVVGLLGVACVTAAGVGLSHLPPSGLGLALVLVGVVGLSIDAQAGRPGAWSVIGLGSLLVGALRFYGGAPALHPPVWQPVLLVAGVALFLLPGLAAVLRSRFSTPTVGRESMVGESGTARSALDPEGVVVVRGAPWRARTSRGAPIGAGDGVRVVAVEGLVLRVEPAPVEGGGSPGNGEPNHRPA